MMAYNPYGNQPSYGAPPMQPGQAPPMQQSYGGPPPQGYGQPGVSPDVLGWFQAVDSDRSGRISATELQQALTNSNWSHFNPETCRLMIGMFDRDHSGTIDINEFSSLWAYIQQWKGVFDQFDRNRSGTIDPNEYHQALQQMGYRVSPAFASLVVTRYDPMARVQIGLDNFIQSCVLLKSITDTFRLKDSAGTGTVNISYEEFLTMVMLNKP